MERTNTTFCGFIFHYFVSTNGSSRLESRATSIVRICIFLLNYGFKGYFEECVLNGQFPIGNWPCCAQMDVNHPQISAKIPRAAAPFKWTVAWDGLFLTITFLYGGRR
jgi:hypothetical protein